MKAENQFKTKAFVLFDHKNQEGFKASIPDEWKQEAQEDSNILVGYASVFGGPPDLGGDIVVPGAFKKTIQERVPVGKVPLTDGHEIGSNDIVGVVLEAREDEYGLLIKARWSSAPAVQNGIKHKVGEGLIKGLSIGYRAIEVDFKKWDGGGDWQDEVIRYLKQVRLGEIALTALPMDENAQVLSSKVRSLPFEALPVAPIDYPWDPQGALIRVKQWANIKDNKPNAKSLRAFLGYEQAEAETMDGCKHLICDVIDGQIKVVPAALYLFAADVIDAGHSLRSKKSFGQGLLTHAARYLNMIGEVPPWTKKSIDAELLRMRAGCGDLNTLRLGHKAIGKFVHEDKAGPATLSTEDLSTKCTVEIKTRPGERTDLSDFFNDLINRKD